jgi:nitroreductase
MIVSDAIAKRRSIRSYKDKPIEKEVLERVLEAGRLAPSACNYQPWRFVVVTDPEMRKKVAKAACDQKFVGEAPAIIVGCAIQTDRVMTCGQYAYPIDVTISMTMMQLAAVEAGLGTCWIGAFHEDEVKKLLGIPKEVRVVQIMPIGYPTSQPAARPRKPMSEFVCMEKWA